MKFDIVFQHKRLNAFRKKGLMDYWNDGFWATKFRRATTPLIQQSINPRFKFHIHNIVIDRKHIFLLSLRAFLSEAISVLGTEGDCFGKKRLAMTGR